METDPVHVARQVFEEAYLSLMAHTTRGVINLFRQSAIDLEIWVIADIQNTIRLMSPERGATSILATRLLQRSDQRDRVRALIYIHKDANKHLARVCIAHEIYHLILELKAFLKSHRTQWSAIPTSKDVEDKCNQFAWELCKLHDEFNKNSNLREKHIHFPEKLFEKPLKTNNTGHHLEWPLGIQLDPENPFHKRLKSAQILEK